MLRRLRSPSAKPKSWVRESAPNLQRKALLAVLYALGGMLVYIAFRFEWIYGFAAVIAVFHDTIITIGLVLALQ